MKGISAMCEDNSIAVEGYSDVSAGKQERSPKENQRTRGPDNRALTGNPPGCALMVASDNSVATNLEVEQTFSSVQLLQKLPGKQACLY